MPVTAKFISSSRKGRYILRGVIASVFQVGHEIEFENLIFFLDMNINRTAHKL